MVKKWFNRGVFREKWFNMWLNKSTLLWARFNDGVMIAVGGVQGGHGALPFGAWEVWRCRRVVPGLRGLAVAGFLGWQCAWAVMGAGKGERSVHAIWG